MRELDSVVNVKYLIFVTPISASNLTGVLCNKKYNVLVLMRGEIILVLTDPSLDAKAAEIASMVGGGKDSNLDDDQESEGHGSISAGIPSFKRSLLIHLVL